MNLTDNQINAISWLLDGIRLYSEDYENNAQDMEVCLKKISAYRYAIDTILKEGQ